MFYSHNFCVLKFQNKCGFLNLDKSFWGTCIGLLIIEFNLSYNLLNFNFFPETSEISPRKTAGHRGTTKKHAQCVCDVRPGIDPGVKGGIQHDRSDQGWIHWQGRPSRYARLFRYKDIFFHPLCEYKDWNLFC